MVDRRVLSTVASSAWWVASPLKTTETTLAYPLIVATSKSPESLANWQARVRGWLMCGCLCRERRGIMTLRTRTGVLLAVFFFAARPVDRDLIRLVVPCLRYAEPAGGWRVLAAALQTIEALALRLGCDEIWIPGRTTGPHWPEFKAGLPSIKGSPTVGRAARAGSSVEPVHAAWGIASSCQTSFSASRSWSMRASSWWGPGSGAGARCRAARSGS